MKSEAPKIIKNIIWIKQNWKNHIKEIIVAITILVLVSFNGEIIDLFSSEKNESEYNWNNLYKEELR